MSALSAGTDSADARAALTALEAEERAVPAHARVGFGTPAGDLESQVMAACDRVLRERVVAELERALSGQPLPRSIGIDSALPLLGTGACGG